MDDAGWIVKRGQMNLHGYTVVDGKACKPVWRKNQRGTLLFSREEGKKIAEDLDAVLVRPAP